MVAILKKHYEYKYSSPVILGCTHAHTLDLFDCCIQRFANGLEINLIHFFMFILFSIGTFGGGIQQNRAKIYVITGRMTTDINISTNFKYGCKRFSYYMHIWLENQPRYTYNLHMYQFISYNIQSRTSIICICEPFLNAIAPVFVVACYFKRFYF